MPVRLNGSSSGYTDITAAAVAGNNTLTLPSTSGTLMTTGGTNTFTANQVIEVTDNTNAALRITQLGTGNALLVEDSANPDSSPFVVTADGNVGVGTTSVTTSDWSTNVTACQVNNSAGYGAIKLTGTSNTNFYLTSGSTGQFVWGISNHPMYFGTNNLERMRIDASGNVLVGATSSITGTNTLQVVNAATDSTQIRVRNSGSTAGQHWRYGTDSVNTIYIINHNSAGVYINNGGTSWSGLSDERAKDIIEPISDAASKVASLRAVIGKYKTDEDGVRRSFLIAQDVQAVLPEAVSIANQETGYLGLSYTDTIPLLTAALQEALTKITALEARIAALENA